MKTFTLKPVKKELIRNFKDLEIGDFVIVEDSGEWANFEGFIFEKKLTFFHKHELIKVLGIEINDYDGCFKSKQKFIFKECEVYRLLKIIVSSEITESTDSGEKGK